MSNETYENLPFTVNQAIIDLCHEKRQMEQRHEEEERAMHEKLWSAVHAEYPELPKEKGYNLDIEHIEGNIVILQAASGRSKDRLMKALVRSLTK